jgi:hypothetical protein
MSFIETFKNDADTKGYYVAQIEQLTKEQESELAKGSKGHQ